MEDLQIVAAQRIQTPLRIALEGPSGAGKTYSALLIAHGLTGGNMARVALIDTSVGTANMYSHLGPFTTIQISAPFYPPRFFEALALCEDAGCDVVIIDTISDEWNGEGGMTDILRGEGYESALRSHRSFLFAVRHAECHVICTIRTRSKLVQAEGSNRSLPRLVQMPVQQDGIETYFNTVLRLDKRHRAHVVKDCTQLFAHGAAEPITPQWGIMLQQWHESAAPQLPGDLQQQINDCDDVAELHRLLSRTDLEDMALVSLFTKRRLELEDEARNETAWGKGTDRLQMIPGGLL